MTKKITDTTPIRNFEDDWGGIYQSGPNAGTEWGKTHAEVERVIKEKVAEMEEEIAEKQDAISKVTATVDNNTGTPTVTVGMTGGQMNFAFQNIKGEAGATGAQGPQGPQGDSVLVGQGDLPLAHVLGNDNTKAISQKGVTDALANLQTQTDSDITGLQNQINAIVADKATVSLTASPSVVFIGEQKAITLTAESSPVATSTVIKKGSTEIQTGTTGTVTGSDTITPSGNVSYQADFVIAGITHTANATVSAVHPIYVGAGTTSNDATKWPTAKTSPAGTYSVNVETSGSYVWFLVPSPMSINSAKKNGLDFPLEEHTTTTKDGVTYKVYRSSNTYDAGTETIVIS